jgi:UrcA family protein
MFKSHRVNVWKVALLVLPALFTVESAFAAVTAEVPPTVTVRYDDLNLNSTAGVASLYSRIQNAATEVCRPAEGPQSVSRMHWTAWNQCFYHAIAAAVQAVHNDSLSAYHWQRIRGRGYQEADTPATVARR